MEQERVASLLRQGSVSLPCFGFDAREEGCARGCPSALHLRRTRTRKIASLAYGRFLAVEQIAFCPQHPSLPDIRSPLLARLVAKGANHAYDLLVRVGVAHFRECRQYAEIQAELSTRYGVEIPVRTIGHLARKFVAYVQVVHHESVPLLRKDMLHRGGYVLHIDGTCEEGSRVLLVCMDSLSGQVLDSRKITSENAKEITEVLKALREEWGSPLAVVHDLRRSLLNSVGEVFPGIPQFICHFHLAADVGKDILKRPMDCLRLLFRQGRTRPKLYALARSLREFAVEADGAHVVHALLAGLPPRRRQGAVPDEQALGVLHGLVSWILAYSRAGRGYGFPFDLPWLDLYERVVAVHDLLSGIRISWPTKTGTITDKFRRLHQILDTVVGGEDAAEFTRVVEEIRRDRKIFDGFRHALRICPRKGKSRRNDEGAPETLSPAKHRLILKHYRGTLEWRANRDKGADRACRIVITHLDKYWPYLFGHRLKDKPREIVAPRTNNVEEREFRKVKYGCRRLHGRGRLTRDVNEMPAGTILLQNLKNTEYVKTVYGGPGEDHIAARFGTVDPTLPAQVMQSWKKDRATTRLPRKLERLKDLPSRLAPVVRAACRRPKRRA